MSSLGKPCPYFYYHHLIPGSENIHKLHIPGATQLELPATAGAMPCHGEVCPMFIGKLKWKEEDAVTGELVDKEQAINDCSIPISAKIGLAAILSGGRARSVG